MSNYDIANDMSLDYASNPNQLPGFASTPQLSVSNETASEDMASLTPNQKLRLEYDDVMRQLEAFERQEEEIVRMGMGGYVMEDSVIISGSADQLKKRARQLKILMGDNMAFAMGPEAERSYMQNLDGDGNGEIDIAGAVFAPDGSIIGAQRLTDKLTVVTGFRQDPYTGGDYLTMGPTVLVTE